MKLVVTFSSILYSGQEEYPSIDLPSDCRTFKRLKMSTPNFMSHKTYSSSSVEPQQQLSEMTPICNSSNGNDMESNLRSLRVLSEQIQDANITVTNTENPTNASGKIILSKLNEKIKVYIFR